MLRSILIGLIFLSYSMISQAMQPASIEGTSVSSAYFNTNINVISETVNIGIAEHFRSARFTEQYEIDNKQVGVQIPLMFALHDNTATSEVSNNSVALSITIDGHPTTVRTIANDETEIRFDDFFKNYRIKPDDYSMYRVEDNTFPDNVSFIENDLEIGRHIIIASYDVMPSYRDNSGLTYEYSYDYSFEPIKSKQNFTSTTVNVNFDGNIEDINMEVFADGFQNLEHAANIDVSGKVITFKKVLPDTIYLSYERQFPAWVKILVKSPALEFFILFCVLAARWHIKELKKSSGLNFSNTIGFIVVAGLFIPFISIVTYTLYEFLAYTVIDAEIIDNMFTFFGTIAYFLLFLILSPFYALFIYHKYYKNRVGKGRDASK